MGSTEHGRCRLAVVVLAAATVAVAVAGPAAGTVNQYEALGLEVGANEIDVQVAYKDLMKLLPERDASSTSLSKLIEGQKSYEALSDYEMREEALGFVDYWQEVQYIRSDDELRRFTEMQVGGSSRLRVIFVVSRPDSKLFEAMGAAIRLYGRARVAQLCHKTMFDGRGMPGNFYSNLKVSEGGVILFDPLSRASKITYEITAVSLDMERLLSGESGTSKLARVQAFDSRTYGGRCSDENSGKCIWSMVAATDATFEAKPTEFAEFMKQFTDACKALQVMEKYPWMACFWLRLERSADWKDKLVQLNNGQALQEGKPTVFVQKRPNGIVVSPSNEAVPQDVKSMGLTTAEHAKWGTFDGIAMYSAGLFRFFEKVVVGDVPEENLPVLPQPMRPDEEPQPAFLDQVMSMIDIQQFVDCATNQACATGVLWQRGTQLFMSLGVLYSDSTESQIKTTLIGGGLFASMIIFFFLWRFCGCLFCCCKRGSSKLTEDQILRGIELLMPVVLVRRSPDERYGLGIEPNNDGGLTVTAVNAGGLVARWNDAQPKDSGRIRGGDRIVAVSFPAGGRDERKTTSADMTKAFQSGIERLTLTLSANRGEAEVRKLASSIDLSKGLDLAKDVETAPIMGGKGGMEVLRVSPAIQERNAKLQAEGACCSQLIEVGDRLAIPLGAELGTQVMNVKARFVDQVRTDTFDIPIQRTGPNDRLGMQVRESPLSSKHMEVLDVLEGGMVFALCATGSVRKVLRGDRLISANGKDGAATMGAEFKADKLVLRFERFIDIANSNGNGSVGAAAAPNGASNMPPAPSSLAAGPPGGMPPPGGMASRGGMALPPACSSAPPGAPMQSMFPTPQAAPSQAAPGFATMAPSIPAPQPQYQAPSSAAAQQPAAPFAPAPVPAVMPQPYKPPAQSGSGGGGVFSSLIALALLAGVAIFVGVHGNKPPASLAALRQTPRYSIPMSPQLRQFAQTVKPGLHGDVGAFCIVAGLMLTIKFLLYEVTMLGRPRERRLLPQVLIALIASNFLGFGSLFVLIWAGVYV